MLAWPRSRWGKIRISDMDGPEFREPWFDDYFKATIFNIISTSTAYLGCLMGLLLLDSGAIKEEYIFGIGTFWWISWQYGSMPIKCDIVFRHGCISLRCCWCFDSWIEGSRRNLSWKRTFASGKYQKLPWLSNQNVNHLNEIISDGFWPSKSRHFCWFHDCGMLFKIRWPDVPWRWMWRSIRLFQYKW